MGFKQFVEKSRLTVWAFSILRKHVHFVLGRHRYKIEYAANLLKVEATRRLVDLGLHPMSDLRDARGRLTSRWGENQWKIHLDTEQAIEHAIRYVEENPLRENLKRQKWSFVMTFEGIPIGGWTTYY